MPCSWRSRHRVLGNLSFATGLLGWITLVAALSPSLSSQQAVDACDPALIRPAGDPLAYGPRGARCEGLYVQEVSGTGGLSIAAFTEPFEPFELASGERLILEWAAPADLQVRLRAVSLRRRLYYRMDAVHHPGDHRFEWPADVLGRLGLSAREVGLRGWVEQLIGDRPSQIHVPLRLGKADVAARTGRYVVLVIPGSDLEEAFVTLTRVESDGLEDTFIQRDEPLDYGYYPAGQPIRINLPPLERGGLYHLQIGALLARGGASTASLHFYHPDE